MINIAAKIMQITLVHVFVLMFTLTRLLKTYTYILNNLTLKVNMICLEKHKKSYD